MPCKLEIFVPGQIFLCSLLMRLSKQFVCFTILGYFFHKLQVVLKVIHVIKKIVWNLACCVGLFE